jgi:Domain of unknown function (DUF3806)
MTESKVPVEIETPHGTVAWKETTKPPSAKVARIVRELSPGELTELERDAGSAPALVKKYVASGQVDDDDLINLDLAFAAWLESEAPDKEAQDEIVRVLGAAYGRYCIERLGVRWALIEDEYGKDMALVRENPTARGFPFSSIRYRIEDRKTDFLYALYASLKHLIED